MIVEQGDLSDLRLDLDDSTVALRFGAYDILHVGHRESLAYAATLAEVVVVGVLPDDYITRQKGPNRPLIPEQERVSAIAEAEAVDYAFVTPGSVLGLARAVRALRPDTYVEPFEHARHKHRLKSSFLRFLGVEYIIDSRHANESSSRIIEHLGRAGAIAHSSFDFELSRQ